MEEQTNTTIDELDVIASDKGNVQEIVVDSCECDDCDIADWWELQASIERIRVSIFDTLLFFTAEYFYDSIVLWVIDII